MTAAAGRRQTMTIARVAAWRVATRKFREHFDACIECGAYLCPEGYVLDRRADRLGDSLPPHAVKMARSIEAEHRSRRPDAPMAAAIFVAMIAGAALIGIPFILALWPWR